jgi:hypothetical protein
MAMTRSIREQKAEDLVGLHISALTQLPIILLVTHNIVNLLSYDFQTRMAQPRNARPGPELKQQRKT